MAKQPDRKSREEVLAPVKAPVPTNREEIGKRITELFEVKSWLGDRAESLKKAITRQQADTTELEKRLQECYEAMAKATAAPTAPATTKA